MLSDDEIDKIRMEVPPSAGIDFDVRCRDFSRAIIAADRAKLLAGVEFPSHPEPHTYRWSRLEEEAIKGAIAAAALNARVEALDEAKGICLVIADVSLSTNKGEMARKTSATAESCAKAIEALKGKV